jgi:hypothetical protein
MRSVRAVIAAASGFLLAAPPGAAAQEDFPGDKTRDEWRNSLVVYLWAVNQDVDLTVGPVQVPLDASFGDLWDIMRFAASAHYEGRKGDWGLLLDGSYVHLGEDGVTVIADPAGEADLLTANYSWKVFRGDALAIWSPLELGSQRLDFLGGIRITSQKTSLNLTGPISLPPELARRGFDEVWVDPIVGVRYGIGWGRYDRWMAWARGDAGGFGIGSDLALNGEIGLAYRISRLVFIAVGGRWLHSDYESGSNGTEGYFAYEGDETGLYLGIGFRF